MRENRYITVKEVLEIPAGSSLSWNDVSSYLSNATSNPLIQDTPAGQYIDIFNNILQTVEPILNINQIVEAVKPAINIGAQVVGAWADPALIPQLVQDGIAEIQKIAVNLLVQGVQYARDFVLNIEIDLGDLGTDTLNDLKDQILSASGDLNKIADSAISSFNNKNVAIDLSAVNACIASYLKAMKDNSLKATNLGTTKDDIINAIKAEFQKTGNCISLDDNSLFIKIDDSLNDNKDVLATAIGDAMNGYDINISNLQSKFAGDDRNLTILRNTKDGLLNSLKNIIKENNRSLLGDYLGKENDDIKRLMALLKERAAKSISYRQFLCMQKITSAISGMTDLTQIKNTINAIVTTCPTDFDLSELLRQLLADLMSGFNSFKKNRNDGSDAANKKNRELSAMAKSIYGNLLALLKNRLASLINGLKSCASVSDLASDQIITDGLSTFIDDVLACIIGFINNLSFFDLNAIIAEVSVCVDGTTLNSYFNPAYNSGTSSICYKFSVFKGTIHSDYEQGLINIKNNYKSIFNINVPTSVTNPQDITTIMSDLDYLVTGYLDTQKENSINVFIRGSVPCKNCVSCGTLQDKILNELKNRAYLLRQYTKSLLIDALLKCNFNGTFAENKATAIAAISTSAIRNAIQNKINFYFDYNSIYKKYCCEEQEKLKQVLLNLL